MNSFDNKKIEGDTAFVKIDLNIYPLKVIYSTSYVFLDKVYIQLMKEESDIVVRMKLKQNSKENLEVVCDEFLNELLVFADYDNNQEETLKVRETILQKVLLTNDPESFLATEEEVLDKEFEEFLKELDEEEDLLESSSVDKEDPNKVVAPWES